MPKKTKKQKLAAEKRKTTHRIEPTITETKTPVSRESTIEKKVEGVPQKSSSSIFKKELYKSIIISTLIILVEIGVFLAQNKGISFINFQ